MHLSIVMSEVMAISTPKYVIYSPLGIVSANLDVDTYLCVNTQGQRKIWYWFAKIRSNIKLCMLHSELAFEKLFSKDSVKYENIQDDMMVLFSKFSLRV